MVEIDVSGAKTFLGDESPDYSAAAKAHRELTEGRGAGSEFTGWLNLPDRVRGSELKRILSLAERVRDHSEALVVIGIGGSYLGARAAIELLRSPYHNALSDDAPEVYFAGNGLSPETALDIIAMLRGRDFSVNIISKSGVTLEPALGFRIFKNVLERKYGTAGARRRIIATTDASKGVLKSIADAEDYECLVVPDDVGGRYSVLSAVGLLPMAVAGIDIRRVTDAASATFRELDSRSPENPAWQYAAVRRQLYERGKTIEILACYDPAFRYMAEWWKQLYGESEGKNGVGIFPASVDFTADLHSMGQYIQDGPRTITETVVGFKKGLDILKVPFEMGDPDGLNYLAGVPIHTLNQTVAKAVKQAHIAGGVPVMEIFVPEKNEEGYAALVCFFELACAISGYMSGINPFTQPGVEEYKAKMFELLSEVGNR